MRAILRCLAIVIAVPLAIVMVGFGLLQTCPGQDWLAGAIARAVSSPGFSLAIQGLRGTVPFHLTAARIDVGDKSGVWLTLSDVALDLAPADLLGGKLHVRSLAIAELDMRRASSGSSAPLSDYLQVPHLPIAVMLDRLTITRLSLAPPVLGEKVVATVAGSAEVERGTARAVLDLRRTDGFSGNIALQMTLAETKPVLDLRLTANEPTGVLIDRWLQRTDRLPLTLSLDGKGPVADWHGRLTVAAGAAGRVDADITLGVGSRTVLGISGKAVLAALLPADLASVVGDQATYSLRAEFGERIVVGRLAIDVAAGTIAGDATFDRSDAAVAAHLRADVPELAPFSGIMGAPLHGSATLSVAVNGSQNHPMATAALSGAGIGVSGSGAERVEVHASATPTGPLDSAATRIAVAANGRIEGLALPKEAALITGLGRGIDWSLAANIERAVTTIDLTRFSARGAGIDLTASGHFSAAGQTIAGQVDFAGSATAMRLSTH
jgi:translocation and assembly module TamB